MHHLFYTEPVSYPHNTCYMQQRRYEAQLQREAQIQHERQIQIQLQRERQRQRQLEQQRRQAALYLAEQQEHEHEYERQRQLKARLYEQKEQKLLAQQQQQLLAQQQQRLLTQERYRQVLVERARQQELYEQRHQPYVFEPKQSQIGKPTQVQGSLPKQEPAHENRESVKCNKKIKTKRGKKNNENVSTEDVFVSVPDNFDIDFTKPEEQVEEQQNQNDKKQKEKAVKMSAPEITSSLPKVDLEAPSPYVQPPTVVVAPEEVEIKTSTPKVLSPDEISKKLSDIEKQVNRHAETLDRLQRSVNGSSSSSDTEAVESCRTLSSRFKVLQKAQLELESLYYDLDDIAISRSDSENKSLKKNLTKRAVTIADKMDVLSTEFQARKREASKREPSTSESSETETEENTHSTSQSDSGSVKVKSFETKPKDNISSDSTIPQKPGDKIRHVTIETVPDLGSDFGY